MCGMGFMGDSMAGLKNDPSFAELLTIFKNPLFGVLIGAVVTGVIQSSAASVAILQSLCGNGLTFGMAIPIIMGQNIGTCVTALISSFGVNRNAKRVAVVHMAFNIIGTVICLIVFYALHWIFDFAFIAVEIDAFGIAMCHMLFNIITTALLFPFQNALVKLAYKIIKDKDGDKENKILLDERLLATPAIAVGHCGNVTVEMGNIAKTAMLNSLDVLDNFDKELASKIQEDEGVVDKYEDELGT